MLSVTAENFESEVMEDHRTVLLDFYKQDSPPCQMLYPIILDVAKEEGKALKLVGVDVQAEPELALTFGVDRVPTLVVVRGGAVIATATGVPEKSEIRKLLI